MSGPPYQEFSKTVNADVPISSLDAWAIKMTNQLLLNTNPGDEVELEVTVDFKNAPKCMTQEQKQKMMDKLENVLE